VIVQLGQPGQVLKLSNDGTREGIVELSGHDVIGEPAVAGAPKLAIVSPIARAPQKIEPKAQSTLEPVNIRLQLIARRKVLRAEVSRLRKFENELADLDALLAAIKKPSARKRRKNEE
jgi:hypothetical protein